MKLLVMKLRWRKIPDHIATCVTDRFAELAPDCRKRRAVPFLREYLSRLPLHKKREADQGQTNIFAWPGGPDRGTWQEVPNRAQTLKEMQGGLAWERRPITVVGPHTKKYHVRRPSFVQHGRQHISRLKAQGSRLQAQLISPGSRLITYIILLPI